MDPLDRIGLGIFVGTLGVLGLMIVWPGAVGAVVVGYLWILAVIFICIGLSR